MPTSERDAARFEILMDLAEGYGRRFTRPGTVEMLVSSVAKIPIEVLRQACAIHLRQCTHFAVANLIAIIEECSLMPIEARPSRATQEDIQKARKLLRDDE